MAQLGGGGAREQEGQGVAREGREGSDALTLQVVWTAERSWVRSPVAKVPAWCWLSRTCCLNKTSHRAG